MIKVSDYIAKRLKEFYNVKNIFMVTGGNSMHLNDSFAHYIPYTCFHNEQAAAMAAEGFSRENNTLAVVNVTSGPGGLNCLNGVFGQWTDSVSVLYISGQVKKETLKSEVNPNLRQSGDQEVDIVSVVSSLTKYSRCVKNPLEIKYHLDRAVYEATHGRKAPVWLDIPVDVQGSYIDENDFFDFEPPRKNKTDLKIDEVVKMLSDAKMPLIVCGHGIRLSNQVENFKKLVEKLNVPVVSTLNGNDIISTDYELHIGRIGTIGQRAGNFALQSADLILFFGTRNNIRQTGYNRENYAKNAKKIFVDIDEAELNKSFIKPDLAINADLKDFIPELLDNLPVMKPLKNWLSHCQRLKEKYSFKNTKEYAQNGEKINPYFFSKVLCENLNDFDTVVAANATATITFFQAGTIRNQRFITNSGDASMGYGLPASVGAFVCKRVNEIKGRVICIEGDGSLMMNLQELQTVKHYNLPIKIFILNNGGYSSCKQTQTNFFNGYLVGANPSSGVSFPDFEQIGNAFGIKSVKIKSGEKLKNGIKEVLALTEPVICEIITDENCTFSPKLSSKKMPDGTIQSPSLENMFPFLSESEISENLNVKE